MRTFPVTLVGLLLLPAVAVGQTGPRDKVEVRFVRVGFAPVPVEVTEDNAVVNPRDSLYKAGAWAPVYVRLANVGKYDPKKDGPAELVIETPDCDDVTTAYTVPVPEFDEDEGRAGQTALVGYARTGNSYGNFALRVVANGKELMRQPYTFGQKFGQSASGLNPNQGLYVAIGTRLPGLGDIGRVKTDQDQSGGTRRKAHVALLPRIGDLPTVWFGYDSADVVILATGDLEFTTGLINDRVRAGALADWVRRGGRLIVCAGANAHLFQGQSELADLLPMAVGKSPTVPSLQIAWKDGTLSEPLPSPAMAGLVPRDKPRGHRVLAEGPAGTGPVVVQGAYGLGRVTVVAFDPDRPPATTWAGLTDFWQQVLARAGPRIPDSVATDPAVQIYTEPTVDLQQKAINDELSAFEGVPVISFGWVALFILIYILVVGPLDYLFLKKVVKRLELTWITFPTVVLAVSAAAYFAAYHLKGRDLRVNKLDVVDIDVQSGRAYGRTWLTLFSPRIQKYTIGFEPAAGWVGPPTDETRVAVTWFGLSKMGQENLFARRYDYAPRAAGVAGVPIQVWTTKGFQGDWSAPLDTGKPPVESGLRHPPGKPDALAGSVTSRLPVALHDVLLIYRGEVANLGPLLPDTPKTVTGAVREPFAVFKEKTATVPGADRLALLFNEAWTRGAEASNGSVRALDQSWRLTDDNRDEVILIGHVPRVLADGKSVEHPGGNPEQRPTAEAVNGGPDVPERLWLERLPQDGGPRPELSGALRQDTVVRIFIPLAPEKRD